MGGIIIEQIDTLVFCLICGIFIAIPATAVVSLLRRMIYVPFKRKSYIELAKSHGNVITAKLDTTHYGLPYEGQSGHTERWYDTCVYKYEWGGKIYKFQMNNTSCSCIMPDELTLYFLKNPGKDCLEYDLGQKEGGHTALYYLILVIALALYMYFFHQGLYIGS